MPRTPHDANKYNEKQKEMKNTFAARLKKCRESKGLSHEKLSEELGISKQALINYEVTDEFNSKYTTGFGMNITYLWQFAEYFDVSTDYLLGRSDVAQGNADDMALEERFGFNDSSISAFNYLSETITEDEAYEIVENAKGKNGRENILKTLTKPKTSYIPFLNLLFKNDFSEIIIKLRDTYEKYSWLDRELAKLLEKQTASNDEEREVIEFDHHMKKTLYEAGLSLFTVHKDDEDMPPYAFKRESPEGFLKSMTRDVIADALIEIVREMVKQEGVENG